MKIVPKDTAISSSSVRNVGPIAALALPPQIAGARGDQIERISSDPQKLANRQDAPQVLAQPFCKWTGRAFKDVVMPASQHDLRSGRAWTEAIA
jgi:hypothetical protein